MFMLLATALAAGDPHTQLQLDTGVCVDLTGGMATVRFGEIEANPAGAEKRVVGRWVLRRPSGALSVLLPAVVRCSLLN